MACDASQVDGFHSGGLIAKFFASHNQGAMTRYTKLDGRRAIPSGSHAEDLSNDVENISETLNNTPSSIKVEHGDVQLEPKKLLKRSKLLRLKAKKAKSEDARTKLLSDSKKMEKLAAKANGARGSLGSKRPLGVRDPTRSTRARLGMF